MKKILTILTFITFLFVLSGCDTAIEDVITVPDIDDIIEDPSINDTKEDPLDDIDEEPEVTVDASEMVQVLSTGKNNFMPDMDQIESDLESGEMMDTEDFTFYEVGCQYGNEYVDNGDGTYTQTFYYYDYDYDYYYMAEEVLYNGIDDDDDGEIDEDDEILIMVTDEMMDGVDNNNNGIVDEYFEMTPTHFVTYTMTFGEVTTTYTNEDGVSTTTGSYSYEWVEIREPYTGQVIETTDCYYEDDYVDHEDKDEDEEFYDALVDVYDALLIEVASIVGDLDDIENQSLYFELTIGRPLTEEEKAAMDVVMTLYESFDDSEPVDDLEYEISMVEIYLDRALTEEERNAFEVYYNYDGSEEMTPEMEVAFELVEELYSLLYERSQIVMLELMLGRSLTEEELLAIEIVFDLDYNYEDDMDSLSDEQQAAITIVENLELEIENSDVNEELLYLMMFLGRPLTDEEVAAFDVVTELMAIMDEAPSPSLEVLITFYEDILGRSLTELEVEAIELFEVYDDYYYSE